MQKVTIHFTLLIQAAKAAVASETAAPLRGFPIPPLHTH